MEELISKELLGEVLGDFPSLIQIDNNEVYIEYGSGFGIEFRHMNIYELANDITEWMENQDYWIARSSRNIYRLIYKDVEVYSINTDKRTTVPFLCGQWIYDNKVKGK